MSRAGPANAQLKCLCVKQQETGESEQPADTEDLWKSACACMCDQIRVFWGSDD